MKKIFTIVNITSGFFYLSILIFLIGFNFTDAPPPSGWYQQFMPNLGGRTISDIFFLDSLTGWAVTPYVTVNDTCYVLKTTDGGDNWAKFYTRIGQYVGFNRIHFLDQNTGFVCGAPSFYNNYTGLSKSTNGGNNWSEINIPDIYPQDMFILTQDIMWLVDSDALVGGVYRTTNGGLSWNQQFSGGNQNPNKIYMYNARIGFMTNNSPLPNIYKTTNSGENWSVNLAGENFTDMHFIDSLLGWKCMPGYYAGDSCVKKTTNGGLNWFKQILPSGGIIIAPVIGKFSFINADTVWGVGSAAFYGAGQFRGIIFRTTNSGSNWLFQIPDTTIHIGSYSFIQFVDRRKGWAYSVTQGGIHTTTGGDSEWLTSIKQITNKIPLDFKLYQNYPNPFNPKTNMRYELLKSSNVKLIVYDITGTFVVQLVDQKQDAGTYEVDFSGNNLSSGIYFYQIYILNEKGGEVYKETKKAVLIK